MNKAASTNPAPTDKPTGADRTSSEPATADYTIFKPIPSIASKKARATKVATKELINYMLLIRVPCGDKRLLRSVVCSVCKSWKAHLTMARGLQKQSAVVAVKFMEIKAPRSTLRLESRAEVVG